MPPGASLSRTDEVQRRVVDIALKTPGVAHRGEHRRLLRRDLHQRAERGRGVPGARAVREARDEDPNQSAAGIQGELFKRCAAIQEALILVMQPPPVAGIGNAGGFRMMVEDRAGARLAGAAGSDLSP